MNFLNYLFLAVALGYPFNVFATLARPQFRQEADTNKPAVVTEISPENPYFLLAKKSSGHQERAGSYKSGKAREHVPAGYDEISDARYVVSGIFSTVLGLGSGQFIQLRPLGFVFLVGEPIAAMANVQLDLILAERSAYSQQLV
jgi:hypothetical protein